MWRRLYRGAFANVCLEMLLSQGTHRMPATPKDGHEARSRGTAQRGVGRPPVVSLDTILDAATEIGLGEVTLRRVAQKLGVGAATLYRHVSGRDELVRLAAFRLALGQRQPVPSDTAAVHWSQVVLAYADSLRDVFLGEPQLINELLAGRLGPEAEVVFLEPFLQRLSDCGVSVSEGMRLHNAVAMLAIGAAAGAAGVRAAGGTAQAVAAMRRTIDAQGRSRFPHVSRGMAAYRVDGEAHWRAALAALLQGFAGERGELLPASPFADADDAIAMKAATQVVAKEESHER